ncbi:hypothetical protein [Streptomyces sp. NPDC053427]|uniref:hypothetical protein n=1 Tax=Streptomyces sp. NPDC053427 TaxID=3365701 RepID=UPI0037D83E5F
MPIDVFAALGALVRAEAARSGKNPTGKNPTEKTRTGKPDIPRPAGRPAPEQAGIPAPAGPEGSPPGAAAPHEVASPGPPAARTSRLSRILRKLIALFR